MTAVARRSDRDNLAPVRRRQLLTRVAPDPHDLALVTVWAARFRSLVAEVPPSHGIQTLRQVSVAPSTRATRSGGPMTDRHVEAQLVAQLVRTGDGLEIADRAIGPEAGEGSGPARPSHGSCPTRRV